MSPAPQNQGSDGFPKREAWLEDVESSRTKRAYETAISDFEGFLGGSSPELLQSVTRKLVEDWRDDLLSRDLSAATVRSKLAAISYLYDLLTEKALIPANPVAGVKRPKGESPKRKSVSESQSEMKALADLPPKDSVKGLRDRAILATLAYHDIRPEEIELLKIGDLKERASDGLPCFYLRDAGKIVRLIPIHAGALQRIYQYLAKVDQADNLPLFRPVKNNVTKSLESSLSASGIRKGVIKYWQDRLEKKE